MIRNRKYNGMKKSHYIILLAFVAFLMLFSFQQNNKMQTDARKAEQLYKQYCASCHGDNFDRFAARQWVYGNSVKDVSSTIKNGRPPIGMPAFGDAMSDAEIEILARYTIDKVAQVPDKPVRKFNINDTIHSLDQIFTLKDLGIPELGIPWGLAFLPNNDLLVTDKSGKLFQISKNKIIRIDGLPKTFVKGQGGLMDVTVHPQFKRNKWIYLSYVDGDGPDAVNTAIARAELKDGKLLNIKKIMQALPLSNRGHHFGCRMVFDKDGYLFFSVGERGEMKNAQLLDNYTGKIHRIHDDGSIPKDNPFVNEPGAVKSIWSYGHRNPQGIIFDAASGILWANEHGPKGGDELNIIRKGKNYGWPIATFGIDYNGKIISNDTLVPGTTLPEFYWIPSIGPSSLLQVTSPKYKGWQGDFLSGSLSFEYLERTIMRNNRVVGREKLLQKIGRVRQVAQSPDGFIYVTVENPGKVYQLIPLQNK